MSKATQIQKKFFQAIKNQLPAHLSLVEDISDLLGISADSAYRRIRGEKLLQMDEIEILCDHYKVSIDGHLSSPRNGIVFHHVEVDEKHFNTQDYLNLLLERAKMINSDPEAKLIVIANDITIFQLLQFPELAAFKMFFWQKSSLGFDSLKREKFSIKNISPEILEASKEVVREYNKINTTEIVGVDALNSFLRQIGYYLELGLFEYPKEADIIIDKILDLIDHFHHETDLGYKFSHKDENPKGKLGNFTMYYNELFVIDGIVLVEMAERNLTFIGTGPLNFISSADESFFHKKCLWAKSLMQRSILLSGISEKDRYKYFSQMRDSVNQFRERIMEKYLGINS